MVGNLARRSFSTLVAAAFSDGDLADPERQVLHRKATELDIPQRLLQDLLDQGAQGKLRIAVPANREARAQLMDDLIDVVCADGRLEAPEHHLLAKFASHIGLALSDLRGMVRERLKRPPTVPQVEPRMEPEIRIIEESPAKTQPQSKPTPPRDERSAPLSGGEVVGRVELLPPGPFRFEDRKIGSGLDIPPVTLGLLKQAILLESSEESLRYGERITGQTRPEVQEMIAAILRAHPEIKPGSMRVKRAPAPTP